MWLAEGDTTEDSVAMAMFSELSSAPASIERRMLAGRLPMVPGSEGGELTEAPPPLIGVELTVDILVLCWCLLMLFQAFTAVSGPDIWDSARSKAAEDVCITVC